MLNIERFTFLPQMFAENTYVIWDEQKKAAVIDPGCYSQAEKNQLVAFIEDNELDLQMVLNTHCHLDHIFGNRRLVDHFQVPLVAHRDDLYNLERAEQFAMLWNLSIDSSPEPDVLVDEGEVISIGSLDLKVMFTPGHSAGHISFFHEESLQLFSGDVIFRHSYGRTDLPGGSISVLAATIRDRIFTLPDETRIYPGHMGPTTVGNERQTNPILNEF